MANITLSIPDDLHKKMKQLAEVRWSEIARKAIEQRIKDLDRVNEIASKSKLTEEDIKEFSKKIKNLANKRFLDEHHR